jgi:hypothetical protein
MSVHPRPSPYPAPGHAGSSVPRHGKDTFERHVRLHAHRNLDQKVGKVRTHRKGMRQLILHALESPTGDTDLCLSCDSILLVLGIGVAADSLDVWLVLTATAAEPRAVGPSPSSSIRVGSLNVQTLTYSVDELFRIISVSNLSDGLTSPRWPNTSQWANLRIQPHSC